MRQILLLIIVFFASQWFFKKLRRAQGAPGAQGAAREGYGGASSTGGTRPAASAPPQLPDPLVRCAECGVHTPRSESVVAAGDRFCSVDHAQRHVAHAADSDAR